MQVTVYLSKGFILLLRLNYLEIVFTNLVKLFLLLRLELGRLSLASNGSPAVKRISFLNQVQG